MLFVFYIFTFFVVFHVVFLLLLKQKRTKLQYVAFLMGKDSISWTE